jgi:hypothetical protein
MTLSANETAEEIKVSHVRLVVDLTLAALVPTGIAAPVEGDDRCDEVTNRGSMDHTSTETVWRLHVVTGSGRGRKTIYRSYPTRELAEAALAGARSQAQGATVKLAVDALLAQMRKDGLADITIEDERVPPLALLPNSANGERPLRWIARRGEELYAAAQVESQR